MEEVTPPSHGNDDNGVFVEIKNEIMVLQQQIQQGQNDDDDDDGDAAILNNLQVTVTSFPATKAIGTKEQEEEQEEEKKQDDDHIMNVLVNGISMMTAAILPPSDDNDSVTSSSDGSSSAHTNDNDSISSQREDKVEGMQELEKEEAIKTTVAVTTSSTTSTSVEDDVVTIPTTDDDVLETSQSPNLEETVEASGDNIQPPQEEEEEEEEKATTIKINDNVEMIVTEDDDDSTDGKKVELLVEEKKKQNNDDDGSAVSESNKQSNDVDDGNCSVVSLVATNTSVPSVNLLVNKYEKKYEQNTNTKVPDLLHDKVTVSEQVKKDNEMKVAMMFHNTNSSSNSNNRNTGNNVGLETLQSYNDKIIMKEDNPASTTTEVPSSSTDHVDNGDKDSDMSPPNQEEFRDKTSPPIKKEYPEDEQQKLEEEDSESRLIGKEIDTSSGGLLQNEHEEEASMTSKSTVSLLEILEINNHHHRKTRTTIVDLDTVKPDPDARVAGKTICDDNQDGTDVEMGHGTFQGSQQQLDQGQPLLSFEKDIKNLGSDTQRAMSSHKNSPSQSVSGGTTVSSDVETSVLKKIDYLQNELNALEDVQRRKKETEKLKVKATVERQKLRHLLFLAFVVGFLLIIIGIAITLPAMLEEGETEDAVDLTDDGHINLFFTPPQYLPPGVLPSRDGTCGRFRERWCDMVDAPCCGSSGFCGSDDEFCGKGCQQLYSGTEHSCQNLDTTTYGVIDEAEEAEEDDEVDKDEIEEEDSLTLVTTLATKPSENGFCGASQSHTWCDYDNAPCCNAKGSCGSSNYHCGPGCQVPYSRDGSCHDLHEALTEDASEVKDEALGVAEEEVIEDGEEELKVICASSSRCGNDWAHANGRCGPSCTAWTEDNADSWVDECIDLGMVCFGNLDLTPPFATAILQDPPKENTEDLNINTCSSKTRCGTDWDNANSVCGPSCVIFAEFIGDTWYDDCGSLGLTCFDGLTLTPSIEKIEEQIEEVNVGKPCGSTARCGDGWDDANGHCGPICTPWTRETNMDTWIDYCAPLGQRCHGGLTLTPSCTSTYRCGLDWDHANTRCGPVCQEESATTWSNSCERYGLRCFSGLQELGPANVDEDSI